MRELHILKGDIVTNHDYSTTVLYYIVICDYCF